jgi:hypothetical protein
MKRLPRRRLIVGIALAIVALVAFSFYHPSKGQLCYAELQGHWWDEKSDKGVSKLIRIEEPHLLAKLAAWRDSMEQQARAESFRQLQQRLLPWLYESKCENALRQPLEQLTLVYMDGHIETKNVDVNKTPLRDSWYASP